MAIVFSIAALLALGLAYQGIESYRDRRRFRPLGRVVAVGQSKLHLHEQGSGAPAVLLEAGLAATSLGWSLVQPEIATFTRVCSYDRAGLGWSEHARPPAPRTVQQMVSELSEALAATRIGPPYILVGHSFGGLLIRAYASLSPEHVAGLVFVDPVSLESWAKCDAGSRRKLMYGIRLSRRGAILARFGLVRAALTLLARGGRRVPKLMGRAAAGEGAVVMQRLVGEVQKLPPEIWPMVRSHWSNPKSFRAMAEYLECLPASAEAAIAMPLPPGVPFVVLSAANATDREIAERDEWVRGNAIGRHVRVEGTGHWIQLERPDVVVDAVRELVDRCRRS
ncbi:MAG: alpha/beta hydrolase [Acidobacteriaceae bacterium]|nr:alpha/beta hydrolase [Acidobacteriaceae bacterium]